MTHTFTLWTCAVALLVGAATFLIVHGLLHDFELALGFSVLIAVAGGCGFAAIEGGKHR